MEFHQQKPHLLLVTFPAQGHINSALQFAKRLLRAGASVTLSTSVSAHRLIDKAHVPKEIEFASFSDGYDDGFSHDGGDGDVVTYMTKFRQSSSESLRRLFEKTCKEGNEITCLAYTLLLPWVSEVACEFQVPSAFLWIQPASVSGVYYYYFRGYGDVIRECENDPSWSLKLPKLPFTLKSRDLPSFLLPSTPLPYTFALPTFREQIEELEKVETPTILINTFEALEVDAMKAVERFTLIPVGPLLPSAFLDGRDSSDKLFGGDLSQRSKEADYLTWLDSQEESSVIYVSFGSISVLPMPQQVELARALIKTHRLCLWVIREKENKGDNKDLAPQVDGSKDEEKLMSCMEELKEAGLTQIVPWCSQVEVLSHPSVGCFVTHCGWNSTLENITCGVRMVGFPQWADQRTNAKLVEDVWRTGVRVKESEEGGQSLVKEEEIKRCLEVVMESEEMRGNAKKWGVLAREAAKEGGGSDKNLKAFIQGVESHH